MAQPKLIAFPDRMARRPRVAASAVRLALPVTIALLTGALAAIPVAAHGVVTVGPPDAANLLLGWSFEPLVAIPLLVLAVGWIKVVGRVNAVHPANPVPRIRTWCFLGGLGAIAVALQSGIEHYDTTLFSIHMVQHILLTLIAPPLIVLAGPITLLLRATSHETRVRWILPVLHSRILRVITFPVIPAIVFAATMWATHFSPMFNLALEDPLIHDLEHALYLGTGLLFWWPALGVDPSPWRMSHPVRAMYVFLQMPQNTFLAVALLSATAPLYPHYVTLVRWWGPTPLEDQQMAGGIMWLAGDVVFLVVILGLIAGWMRHEERATAQADRRADAEMAAIHAREAMLAERMAGGQGGDDR